MTEYSISKAKLHTEEAFEQHFVSKLVGNQNYIERQDSNYDKDLAFDEELLVEFIKNTQPETWQVLEGRLGGKASEMLCKEIDRVLKKKDVLSVLKEGIQFTWSPSIKLCYFEPASNINPNLEKLFKANILSVIRQVHYSNRNNNSIDVVLFLNGIPVAVSYTHLTLPTN